jgi:hypothetical protein
MMLHLKRLEKQEQAKCKISRRRKIIKVKFKSVKPTPNNHKKNQKNKKVVL